MKCGASAIFHASPRNPTDLARGPKAYAEVEPTKDAWILRNQYDRRDKRSAIQVICRVPWGRWIALARQVLVVLTMIHADRPRTKVLSGTFSKDIAQRIADYRAIVESLESEHMGD